MTKRHIVAILLALLALAPASAEEFPNRPITWVVPFACVSYYPGLLLLGRPEAQPWMAAVAPLAAAAMVVVASIVWRWGLARYQGTGH